METYISSIFDSKIFATLLGVIIGFWLSLKANRNQRYLEAAAQFREVFFDEVIACEEEIYFTKSKYKISEIMSNALIKHKKATLRFRPYIKRIQINNFDKACKEYFSNEYRFGLYVKPITGIGKDNTFEATTEKEKRDIFLHQIHRLLEFTPIK